ncbi:MAG: CCA tRNA nucleotidyltransferase [Planctomycetes bacterium]|nr:CCA tRNA nucleotidyltransferase [Planctomycetota bacterium]
MTDPQSQRDFALEIVKKLRDAGHEALWAGGCVRDRLLSLEPKDYDVATSARPEEVRELFGHRRTLAIGAAFGVISVLGGLSRGPIEVATFRADGAYLDGRHPVEVVFTGAEQDAQRRDFTINGLFFDPLEETVIDYVGGQQDLELGIVRAIGDPRSRFAEDKLRILRAVRFAAAFSFQIEADTLVAIGEMAEELKVVSAERIGMELRRMLVDEHRARAVSWLESTGLLQQVVSCWPSAEHAGGEERLAANLQKTLTTLDRLESPSLPLALAALLSQCESNQTGPSVARELRYTKKEAELTGWLLTHVPQVGRAHETPWPVVQRLLVHAGAHDLVALHDALVGGEDEGAAFCRAKLQLPPQTLNPPPLVDGADLVAHGVPPGPAFAELLQHLRDAQLDGRIADREQALTLADEWLRSRGEQS